jgi:hypothetical protein
VRDRGFRRGRLLCRGQGAHTGIGTLPIVLLRQQRAKGRNTCRTLVPVLKIHAFCLTESGRGLGRLWRLPHQGRALRRRQALHHQRREDVHHQRRLGLDYYIVFAKIDGQFSAFIVDRDIAGVSSGAEEEKMGIKGSSTTTVIFEDAKVPAENLLYRDRQGSPCGHERAGHRPL